MGDEAAASRKRQEGRLSVTTLVPEAATAASSASFSYKILLEALNGGSPDDVLVEARAIDYEAALAVFPQNVGGLEESGELPVGKSAFGV